MSQPLPDNLDARWHDTVQLVAGLHAQAQAQSRCAEPECACFGQARTSHCGCAQEPDALAAASLLTASADARRAQRAHARRALDLQLNDKTGWFA